MYYNLYKQENSLRNFLIEEQSDAYHSRSINPQRYNNLRLYMDIKRNSIPHLIIRIGISEAMYSIENGELLSGSLSADTRYVPKWLTKMGIREELMEHWDMALHTDET